MAVVAIPDRPRCSWRVFDAQLSAFLNAIGWHKSHSCHTHDVGVFMTGRRARQEDCMRDVSKNVVRGVVVVLIVMSLAVPAQGSRARADGGSSGRSIRS
jgi:hypothetical protein